MKCSNLTISLILIFLVTFNTPSGDTKFAVSPLTKSNNVAAQLRLGLSIVERGYCSNDQLCLTLRLTFTNVGDQPIILDKNSSVIGRHMVSRSLKAAAAKKYVENVSPFLDAMSVLRINASPDASLFVTLALGESLSVEKKLDLFVYDGNKENEDLLHPGDYYLEVVVLTWYYPQTLKAEARKEWKQKGYLWTDPIKSGPLSFNVEKHRPFIATLLGHPTYTLKEDSNF